MTDDELSPDESPEFSGSSEPDPDTSPFTPPPLEIIERSVDGEGIERRG